MMKNLMTKWLAAMVLIQPLLAFALQFDEIKDFGEVFNISAEASNRSQVTVQWDIADGYYLYNNKFLSFKTDTPGVTLGPPEIPDGERGFDELLEAQVIKFHHRLKVKLPLETIPAGTRLVSLRVRSQGCLENVLCYPPTEQLLAVSLPDAPVTVVVTPDSSEPLADLITASNSGPGQVSNASAALAPEDAFTFEAIGLSADSILARFTSQPGYYLYRDKFNIRVTGDSGFQVSAVELPKGVLHTDPEFGPVEVYYDQIEVPVRVDRPAGTQQLITLTADYQGCRDGDICYPPQTSSVKLLLSASSVAGGQLRKKAATGKAAVVGGLTAGGVSEQDRLASMLISNPLGALLAFFVAGILLAFTPCVFPMIPILSGIIAGQGERMTTYRAFWLSLVYVLAMAVTYTVAGVLAGLVWQEFTGSFPESVDYWILYCNICRPGDVHVWLFRITASVQTANQADPGQ